MRRSSIVAMALAAVLGAPQTSEGQTRTYQVRGKEVRLEVDRSQVLVVPQANVSPAKAAEAAFSAQAKTLRVANSAEAVASWMRSAAPQEVRKVRGVLVQL